MDTQRGDVDAGLREGAVRIDATYTTPMQHHNPIEPRTRRWRAGTARRSRCTMRHRACRASTAVAAVFGIAPDHVRVIPPFLGGGFWLRRRGRIVSLCAMAAKQVGRPVRLALTRPQMFGPVGGRPFTEQRIVLAARQDGTLTAMRHDTIATTSTFED